MAEYKIRKERGMFQFQYYVYIWRWWWPFWSRVDHWPYDTIEAATEGAEHHASNGTYLGKFQKS